MRSELDEIDQTIVETINRRAAIAQQIGQLKRGDAKGVYDPARENEVLQSAVANNIGPLTDDAVRAVFRELVSASRDVQLPTRVAYLGPEFTFSHLAAIEGFGQSAELVPVGTIAAVFEEVERGQAQFGVVPMENSTDGRVSDTLECFARSHVRICAGLPLRIHHCLLGIGARDDLRTVYSKPQPLSQCRNWLARHLPNVDLHEVGSTAEAARRAKDDPRSAAVASAQAGIHYGLPVLVRNIEDNADNVTRFAVISQVREARRDNDKTALLFEIAHQPGTLADALVIFKRNRLNMTMDRVVSNSRQSRHDICSSSSSRGTRMMPTLGEQSQSSQKMPCGSRSWAPMRRPIRSGRVVRKSRAESRESRARSGVGVSTWLARRMILALDT